MKPTRRITLLCGLLLVAAVAADPNADDAPKDYRDAVTGKWHGDKGTFKATDTLTITKYEGFKPGTAGDYKISQFRSDLVGPGGKKLPPTDVAAGTGSCSLDGDKLTLTPGAIPGPLGKDKVVWQIVKVTDDALAVKTDKGATEEFKKAK